MIWQDLIILVLDEKVNLFIHIIFKKDFYKSLVLIYFQSLKEIWDLRKAPILIRGEWHMHTAVLSLSLCTKSRANNKALKNDMLPKRTFALRLAQEW